MLAVFSKVGEMRLRKKQFIMYLWTLLKIKNNLTGKSGYAKERITGSAG
jgi:hypothetical protein